MGKRWRHIIASGLLAVYSLALALVCSEGYSQYLTGLPLQKTGAENYQSIVTGDQPGGALVVNKPVDAGFSSAHIAGKKSINEATTTQKSVDRQLASSFAQYHFVSVSIAIRQRIAEGLFPFHFFL